MNTLTHLLTLAKSYTHHRRYRWVERGQGQPGAWALLRVLETLV